ncbi:hypothetical protein RI129_012938 [Pyrocoelia pectoralis]|uniref:Peptidase S1 domain-containing protein n=1 Tax=Pyrocoelia pectoralis TaxID=417401 RepID=A0AAN7V3J6_9COLE
MGFCDVEGLLVRAFTLATPDEELLYAAADKVDFENRIVQGTLAGIGQFPYQVSLRNKTLGHFCGGAIIKEYYVVTSAKCVQGLTADVIYIVTGTNELLPSGRTVAVVKVLRHESYDSSSLKNNIALLKTKEDLTKAYRASKIALNYVAPYPGQKCVLSGWGKEYAAAQSFSNYLRYAELTIMALSDCQRVLYEFDIDGGCHGDNGGPLVNYNVLYGILSWGFPCATDKPDVYINIAKYSNWINDRSI